MSKNKWKNQNEKKNTEIYDKRWRTGKTIKMWTRSQASTIKFNYRNSEDA